MTQQIHQKIRHKLGSVLSNNSLLILFSGQEHIRNNDVFYKYRQSSNFFYLTGINDSNLVLLIEKINNKINSTLICPRPNEIDKIWTGQLPTSSTYKKTFNIDSVIYDDQIESLQLSDYKNLYSEFNDNSRVNKFLGEIKNHQLNRYLREGKNFSNRIDISEILFEMRRIKNKFEIKQIKTAAKISSKAHIDLIKNCKPGISEYELEANFINICMKNKCEQAYPAIVASGKNSRILHYTKNDCILKDGDLLLVDAAAEYNNYASDITRTIPVSGKYSSAQRKVYDVVLHAQKEAIKFCKVGKTMLDVHNTAVKFISIGLIKLGLLNGTLQKNIKQNLYKRFYMHNTGHWLGLDVHDPSPYLEDKKPVKFEPGMIFTVEPGIYIDGSKDIPKEYRNIGIRIEDDILITQKGPEILTSIVPKSVSEIEGLMNNVK